MLDLLLEGGVAGHMSHLYEDPSLTIAKLKEILIAAAEGELEGTEKTDGQNLFLSYDVKTGEAKAARNKGNIKAGGLTAEELADKFAGRGSLEAAFIDAFDAFERAVSQFSDEEKVKIFGPDTNIYYNAEIQDPRNANVINYDFKTLNIHRAGHGEFDRETGVRTGKDVSENAAALEQALERVEDKLEGEHRIQVNAIRKLQGLEDKTALNDALAKVDKAASDAGISDNQTIGDYVIARLSAMTDSAVALEPEVKKLVIKKILGVKGLNITKILKMIEDPQTKATARELVKQGKNLLKKATAPLEEAIHDYAVELLSIFDSAYVVDNSAEAKRLRDEVTAAIEAIKASGSPEATDILVQQLKKLEKLDKTLTAAEGFVFDYDDQTYKFTGNFAPINQILGLFKYGRGSIPAIKRVDEQMENEMVVAIVPGGFKLPHKGHFEMIRHYANLADVVKVYISPKARQSKDGTQYTFAMAKKIFDLYAKKNGLNNVVFELSPSNSPVRAAYEYVGELAKPGEQVILGTSTKGGDQSRFARSVQKYAGEGVTVLDPMQFAFDPTGEEPLSATGFREALSSGVEEEVEKYLPDNITVDDVMSTINNSLEEALTGMVNDIIMSEKKKEKYFGKTFYDIAMLHEVPLEEEEVEEEIEEISAAAGAGGVGAMGHSGQFRVKRKLPEDYNK
jgi:hypothetical protein